MKKRAVKFIFLICLLLSSMSGEAQTNAKDELPRGVVIERVACRKKDVQSYALYLPSSYAREKKWAALYAFDPMGNGKVPVEIFRDAAERYGFIIVGSNDSRNNLAGEKLSEIIDAFWTDTHERFSLDERRTYTAGFSGGARVANAFAISCDGCIAGVVASGATFTSKFPLDKPLPYAIFGTAGVDDFNFAEMVETFERLAQTSGANRLEIFDGRHQWLTKDLANDALEWMNFQAMKSGRLEMKETTVADFFKKQNGKAESLLQKGDLLPAARAFENIVKDFKSIFDTTGAAEKLAEITARKAYKKLLAEERNSFERQQTEAGKIISSGTNLFGASAIAAADDDDKSAALRRVSGEIETWRKKSKAAEDSNERRLARRILAQIFVAAYEAALQAGERRKDFKAMTANLQLARLVNPQNGAALFELARAFALDGKKKMAVETLEEAVKNGFADCGRIKGNPEWEKLRGDERFLMAIKTLDCR